MNKLIALAVFGLVISPAQTEARSHCGHGKLYRVSMGRCVGANSKLGQEIRPHRRSRYAHLEIRHHFHRRGPATIEQDQPKAEPDTFVDVLLPDDGSLDEEADGAKREDPPNPSWPKGWDRWNPPHQW